MKTLIVAPNWIGDAIMAQPLFALLKRARSEQSQQSIDVLAPSWVAPVLEAMPEVDRVIPTSLAHGKFEWRARGALASQLRDEAYDRAFVLPNSFKSALIPWLARIDKRIGYLGEARYGLLNLRLDNPDSTTPMVRRYAALASAAGVEVPADVLADVPAPHLSVGSEAIDAALAKFGLDPRRRKIALCPGAEYGPAKRWPASHFAELADKIFADDERAQIVLLGGSGDRSIAQTIVGGINASQADSAVFNLAGTTNLSEAIALIAASDAVVSNDSGLMHIAAALQRPQVAIFGSSDPRHTPPLSSKAQIIWLHLSCSPCFERTCPLGHLNCLKQISPQRVMDEMNRCHAE